MKRLSKLFFTLFLSLTLIFSFSGETLAAKKKKPTTTLAPAAITLKAVTNDGTNNIYGSVLDPSVNQVLLLLPKPLLAIIRKMGQAGLKVDVTSALDSTKVYSIPKEALSIQRRRLKGMGGRFLVANISSLTTQSGVTIFPGTLPTGDYRLRIKATDLDATTETFSYRTPALIVGTVKSDSTGIVTVEDLNGELLSDKTVAISPNGTFITEVRANRISESSETTTLSPKDGSALAERKKSMLSNQADETEITEAVSSEIPTGVVHAITNKDLYAVVPLDNNTELNAIKPEKPVVVSESSSLAANIGKEYAPLVDKVALKEIKKLESEEEEEEEFFDEDFGCDIYQFAYECDLNDEEVLESIGRDFKDFAKTAECEFPEFELLKEIVINTPDSVNAAIGKGYCTNALNISEDEDKACLAYEEILFDFKSGFISQLPCPPEDCIQFKNIKPPKCFIPKEFCNVADLSNPDCIVKPVRDLFCARVGIDIKPEQCTNDIFDVGPFSPNWKVVKNSRGNEFCVPTNLPPTPSFGSGPQPLSTPEGIADECEISACHDQCEESFPKFITLSTEADRALRECHFTCDAEAGRIVECVMSVTKYFSNKCCQEGIIGPVLFTQQTLLAQFTGRPERPGSFTPNFTPGRNPIPHEIRPCLCASPNNFNEKGYVKEEAIRICDKVCPEGFEKDPNREICLPVCPQGFFRDPNGGCRKKCPEGFEQDDFGNCFCPEGKVFGPSGKCETPSTCPEYCKNIPRVRKFLERHEPGFVPPGISSTTGGGGFVPPECKGCFGDTVGLCPQGFRKDPVTLNCIRTECGQDQNVDSTGICRCNNDGTIATSMGPEGCKKQNPCGSNMLPNPNTGPNQAYCVCPPLLPYWDGNQCVSVCPPGKEPAPYTTANLPVGSPIPCSTGQGQCSGSTPYLYKGSCVATCPTPLIPLASTVYARAILKESHELTTPSSQQIKCLCPNYSEPDASGQCPDFCKAPRYKDSTGACVCPSGQYYDSSNPSICVNCPACLGGKIFNGIGCGCSCPSGQTENASGQCSSIPTCAPGQISTPSSTCACASGATITTPNGACQCSNGGTYSATGCSSTITCPSPKILDSATNTCKCPTGQIESGTGCTSSTPTSLTIKGRFINKFTQAPVQNISISGGGVSASSSANGDFTLTTSVTDLTSTTSKSFFYWPSCYYYSGYFILSKNSDSSLSLRYFLFDLLSADITVPVSGSEINLGNIPLWPSTNLNLSSDIPVSFNISYPEEGRGVGNANYKTAHSSSNTIPLNYDVQIKLTDSAGMTYQAPTTMFGLDVGCKAVTLKFFNGQLSWESPVQTVLAPQAPSNLQATLTAQGKVNLTWTDNSTNETSFSIYIRPSGGTGWSAPITTVGSNISTYLDSPAPGAYEYKVTACNATGCSSDSNFTFVSIPVAQICQAGQASTTANLCKCATGATFNTSNVCTCPTGQIYSATGCSTTVQDEVTLTSVIINTSNVVVNYGKNFLTCAHLKNTSNVLLHTQNLFCSTGTNLSTTNPLSSFTNLQAGTQVKLCHGNNGNICSQLVTVTNASTCSAGQASTSTSPCTCATGGTFDTSNICTCPTGQTYSTTGCSSSTPTSLTIKGRFINKFTQAPVTNLSVSGSGVSTSSNANGDFSLANIDISNLTTTSSKYFYYWPSCYYYSGYIALSKKSDGSLSIRYFVFDLLSADITVPVSGSEINLGDIPLWPAVTLKTSTDIPVKLDVSFPEEGRGVGNSNLVTSHTLSNILLLNYDVQVKLTDSTGMIYQAPSTRFPLENGCNSITLYLANGVTSWQGPTVTYPLAPSNLQATSTIQGQVNLTWTDNSNNETSFSISRRPSGTSAWTTVTNAIASNITSYTDSNLLAGTYEYHVNACNSVGCSVDSNTAIVAVAQACISPKVLNTTTNTCTCPSGYSEDASGNCIQKSITLNAVTIESQSPNPDKVKIDFSANFLGGSKCAELRDVNTNSDLHPSLAICFNNGPISYDRNTYFTSALTENTQVKFCAEDSSVCSSPVTVTKTVTCPTGQQLDANGNCYTPVSGTISLSSVKLVKATYYSGGAALSLTFSKSFSDCVRLTNASGVSLHAPGASVPSTCYSSTNIAITQFTSEAVVGAQVKLCTLDGAVCSSIVTITE